MEPTEITAGRLHLRPWAPWDAPALQELLDDPEIGRWTPYPHPVPPGLAAERIAGDAEAWASGSRAELAVLDATTAELLGTVGLYRIRPDRADVGWLTGAAARGRGIATEAVGALCRWAFGALGLAELEAQVLVGNHASRRVAEKCGFRLAGETDGCWRLTLGP
jgi:RimJ/RimL family protein N-acetyltransferase